MAPHCATGTPLERNKHAWNNLANIIFIESPAGVGFSYSNRTSDMVVGDDRTTADTVTFMREFVKVFPQFKHRCAAVPHACVYREANSQNWN